MNIGARQRGRMAASSVFHCDADTSSITDTIQTALKADLSHTVNPYGQGNAGEVILDTLKVADLSGIKTFYDISKVTQ